jgi:hypothetical protein
MIYEMRAIEGVKPNEPWFEVILEGETLTFPSLEKASDFAAFLELLRSEEAYRDKQKAERSVSYLFEQHRLRAAELMKEFEEMLNPPDVARDRMSS